MAIDLLMDSLTGVIRGVPTNIDIDALVDLSANLFADVLTVLKFDMPGSLDEFRCCAAFDCRPMAVLNRTSDLQDRMPSYHV